MVDPKDVTCIIPQYGTTRYLRETVLSAMAQGFGQILVVDQSEPADPVRADTPQSHLNLPPDADSGGVIVLNMPKPWGAGPARNLAIRHAQTPYVALLDHDDLLMPGYLTNALAYLKSNNLRCVGGNLFYIGENSARRGARVGKHKDFVLPSGFLLEKSLALEVGLFENSVSEDLIFFRNIRQITTITTCPDAHVLYRIHGHSSQSTATVISVAVTRMLPLYYSGRYTLPEINTIAKRYADTGFVPAGLEVYLGGNAVAQVRAFSRGAYASWLNRDLVGVVRQGVHLLGYLPELRNLVVKKWSASKTVQAA